jgi:hypothetical protein
MVLILLLMVNYPACDRSSRRTGNMSCSLELPVKKNASLVKGVFWLGERSLWQHELFKCRNHSAPGRNRSVPGRNRSVPGRNHSVPGRNHSAPGRNRSVPGRNRSAPGRNRSVPGRNHSVPGRNHSVGKKTPPW